MSQAVIALGSNIGDTLKNLKDAVAFLEERGCNILKKSSLYKTEPWGYKDQEDFLNGAILIETSFDVFQLLEVTQSIEKHMGRKKEFLNGPRNIDLDILLYEGVAVATEHLTVPHLRIQERLFVLKPLMDIVPQWQIGNMGNVAFLLEKYRGNERIEKTDLIL